MIDGNCESEVTVWGFHFLKLLRHGYERNCSLGYQAIQ